METKKLSERLKSLLEKNQRDETKRRIERLSSDLLEEAHFAYDSDRGVVLNVAEILAEIDLDKLERFVRGVKEIRDEVAIEYSFALKNLMGEYDEQA